MGDEPGGIWSAGAAYQRYIGRWSRPVARKFLHWLGPPVGAAWVDVGCGTGALTEEVLTATSPQSVMGIDQSEGFIRTARRQLGDPRGRFKVGDATDLPLGAASADMTVSGLVLNFVPEPAGMIREMQRVTKPGGRVAAYVWDYASGMVMLRHFWDAAVAVTPSHAELDEAKRFPVCRPDALTTLWRDVGLDAVAVCAVEVPTVFRDFDDYWTPFLGRQGPAPAYLASLDAPTQEHIREAVRAHLPVRPDGTIALTARAWAVQGTVA